MNSLNSRYNIIPQDIILFGESIGSAATVYLASEIKFAGVVLQSAFMSGIRLLYFYERRTWLFDPFPTIERVPTIECPVLVIHGAKDTLVPIKHGFAIYNRIKYKVEPLWLNNADHNDVRFFEGYYARLESFASSL